MLEKYQYERINNAAAGFTTTNTTQVIAAPGAHKRIVVDEVQFTSDPGTTWSGVGLVDATSSGTVQSTIWALAQSDFINTGPLYQLRFPVNKPVCVQRTIGTGAGTLYYDIRYHIEG